MRLALLTLCALAISSCKSSTRDRGNEPDLSLLVDQDGGSEVDFSGLEVDLAMMSDPLDFAGLESGTAYSDLSIDNDASGCAPGQSGTACLNPIDVIAGCGAVEDCIAMGGGTGNGLDDDCNGKVDDGCSCTPGDVQRCFIGPPGKANVANSGCTQGTMTCI